MWTYREKYEGKGGGRAVSSAHRCSGQEFRSDLMRCPAGLFDARNVVDCGLGDGGHRFAREKALMACDEAIRACQAARENIILQNGFRQVSEEAFHFSLIDLEAKPPPH